MNSTEPLEIWRMNAFTTTPFTGNPAGVVLGADALSDQQMQLIAPQLNSVSETVFVCAASEPSADLCLRYFTSKTEVNLCGHATISALFALAASGQLKGSDERRTLKAQTQAGILELGIEFAGGKLIRAFMTQPLAEHDLPTSSHLAAEILGLNPFQIRNDLPIACASTGIWSCYVPLVNLQALASISVDFDSIESLWPENNQFAGIYPFVITDNSNQPDRLETRGRFFCPPKFGIAEDPVTGTASGALAAYLIQEGVLSASGELEAHQGIEMGNPGNLLARQTSAGEIEISGQAVPVYCGQLIL